MCFLTNVKRKELRDNIRIIEGRHSNKGGIRSSIELFEVLINVYMIHFDIPGMEPFDIENLCLDYNGTIAKSGKLIEGVREKILLLKNKLNIYILTADTYGTTEKECNDMGIIIKKFDKKEAGICKEEIVKSLNGKTISFGNGFNDIQMFDNSFISIGVIEKEGMCAKLINHSTIVVNNILDAFDLLLDVNKMKAGLRN